MRVYHFLPAEYALVDLALRRLKIARISEVNDPFELNAINVGGKKEFRAALNATRRDLSETKGLLCFSKNSYEPVMWSHYAARHHGICLGFDIPTQFIKEVDYTAERVVADQDENGKYLLNEDLMGSMLFTKYKNWAYEEEVRMFVELDPDVAEDGIYYYEFDDNLLLREVILGPLCAIPIERIVGLTKQFEQKIRIIKSRLAYKFFRVVPDERCKNFTTGDEKK